MALYVVDTDKAEQIISKKIVQGEKLNFSDILHEDKLFQRYLSLLLTKEQIKAGISKDSLDILKEWEEKMVEWPSLSVVNQLWLDRHWHSLGRHKDDDLRGLLNTKLISDLRGTDKFLPSLFLYNHTELLNYTYRVAVLQILIERIVIFVVQKIRQKKMSSDRPAMLGELLHAFYLHSAFVNQIFFPKLIVREEAVVEQTMRLQIIENEKIKLTEALNDCNIREKKALKEVVDLQIQFDSLKKTVASHVTDTKVIVQQDKERLNTIISLFLSLLNEETQRDLLQWKENEKASIESLELIIKRGFPTPVSPVKPPGISKVKTETHSDNEEELKEEFQDAVDKVDIHIEEVTALLKKTEITPITIPYVPIPEVGVPSKLHSPSEIVIKLIQDKKATFLLFKELKDYISTPLALSKENLPTALRTDFETKAGWNDFIYDRNYMTKLGGVGKSATYGVLGSWMKGIIPPGLHLNFVLPSGNEVTYSNLRTSIRAALTEKGAKIPWSSTFKERMMLYENSLRAIIGTYLNMVQTPFLTSSEAILKDDEKLFHRWDIFWHLCENLVVVFQYGQQSYQAKVSHILYAYVTGEVDTAEMEGAPISKNKFLRAAQSLPPGVSPTAIDPQIEIYMRPSDDPNTIEKKLIGVHVWLSIRVMVLSTIASNLLGDALWGTYNPQKWTS